MPNLDKSGPTGEGPMTGRKQGRCNPQNKGLTKEEILQQEENQQNPPVRGLGLGLGLRRRGRRGPGRGGAGRGRW